MANQFPEQLNNPAVESTLRQWHEFDGLHRLTGTKCTQCGRLFFPKRSVCTECHSLKIEEYQFSGNGTIENFNFQFLPPVKVMGFREQLNRAMIAVKLDEGPTIIAELADYLEQDRVKKGSKVKMVIRKIARSGNSDYKYAYKFILSN
ncbi:MULTISPECIES: Zn-ribbon domain-containing OB-fold protein [Latilactobacillus]|uniref:Zn-ribbon domain-containing OB-fold protein n=1 Tax=Latilactobacillus TaxID=2767885 RepID=UPI00202E5863|nr:MULTISPECIES: zinc ribbon domain-containing protein [Latilactobacillus]MCM1635768.1 zinc ribbon domain-containing protein [Latilactobacillus sakei]MCW8780388.1 zinc ribbon domain-containing protein [Latilactobacillus curvatus]